MHIFCTALNSWYIFFPYWLCIFCASNFSSSFTIIKGIRQKVESGKTSAYVLSLAVQPPSLEDKNWQDIIHIFVTVRPTEICAENCLTFLRSKYQNSTSNVLWDLTDLKNCFAKYFENTSLKWLHFFIDTLRNWSTSFFQTCVISLYLVKGGLSEKHTKFKKIFLMVWTFTK